MKDLEFLYSYNAGGTMTESSNYDEAANYAVKRWPDVCVVNQAGYVRAGPAHRLLAVAQAQEREHESCSRRLKKEPSLDI